MERVYRRRATRRGAPPRRLANIRKALRDRLFVFLAVVVVFLAMMSIYEVIGPLYASEYRFRTRLIGLSESWLIAPTLLVYMGFLYRQHRRDSLPDLFIIILTLTYFLPGNILYLYGNWTTTYYVFIQLSYICLCTLNEITPKHFRSRRHAEGSHGEAMKRLYTLSLVLGISVLFISLVYNGLRITISLENVYDLREEWRESSMPNIFNYYLPFAARITPVLLVISIKDKKMMLAALLVLTQLSLFSFGGMKYTFFALILALIVGFTSFRITGRRVILFYVAFVLVCLAECTFVTDDLPIVSVYTLRRFAFVPNQISFFFFDFFQHRDYLYYSDSFLRWLLDYPYKAPFPHVIGDYAFGSPEMGANTGLFAEGYSQIGWLAVPVYSVLYILAFRVYSFCSAGFERSKYSQAAVLGVALYALSFQDGSFFSILLTQGFLLTLLAMYYISNSLKSARDAGAEAL